MDKLSGEERQDNDKVDQALSYFDDMRVEKDEEVAGLQLRRNQEKYYEFCRELIPDVVGRIRFKARVVAKLFMEVVTRSNEAFALLCFNNLLEVCKEKARWAGVNIGGNYGETNKIHERESQALEQRGYQAFQSTDGSSWGGPQRERNAV